MRGYAEAQFMAQADSCSKGQFTRRGGSYPPTATAEREDDIFPYGYDEPAGSMVRAGSARSAYVTERSGVESPRRSENRNNTTLCVAVSQMSQMSQIPDMDQMKYRRKKVVLHL